MNRFGGIDRENANANVIRHEYRRLDTRWLSMQFQANLWMVLFATAAEIAMFFILHGMNAISTSGVEYGLKYVLTPFSANLAFLLVSDYTLKSKRRTDRQKIYIVSVVVSLCCFVVYTVHSVFIMLNLIFAIPIVMTVVYADGRLTTLISLLCIAEKVVADLFLKWDEDKVDIFSSKMTAVDFFLSLLILLILYVVCLLILRIEHDKNQFSIELMQERRRLQLQAATDPLTGLWNRQELRRAFNLMEKNQKPYALAMVDLDDFKALNDTYGHACGDTYLIAMGHALEELSSETVTPFRFGGDEFCILMEKTDLNSAEEICRNIQERLRDAEENLTPSLPVTMSIGIAGYCPGEKPSVLLQRADHALYRAKQNPGTVCFADETM